MFRFQKIMIPKVFLSFDKKDPETRQKTFDIDQFLKTAIHMSLGTLWRICLEKKQKLKKFTRTV